MKSLYSLHIMQNCEPSCSILTNLVNILTHLGFFPSLAYSKQKAIPSSSVSYCLISSHENEGACPCCKKRFKKWLINYKWQSQWSVYGFLAWVNLPQISHFISWLTILPGCNFWTCNMGQFWVLEKHKGWLLLFWSKAPLSMDFKITGSMSCTCSSIKMCVSTHAHCLP